jgi:hypothetical protein
MQIPPEIKRLGLDAVPQEVADELTKNGWVIVQHRANISQTDDLCAELQPYIEKPNV